MKRRATIVPAGSRSRAKPGRGRLRNQVLERIRVGLMAGAFAPGQMMSLRKLAAGLGTSPMPVREALKQLVAANALEELPNHSVRVPRLSQARLAELFRVREVVEGLAAADACAKASSAVIDRLEGINDQLIGAISRRNVVGCLAANQKFHFTLYRAAESQTLMPLIESLWLQCGPTLYLSLLLPAMPWDASEHAEILTGLRARKPAVVRRALARDMRSTARSILSNANSHILSQPSLIGMEAFF